MTESKLYEAVVNGNMNEAISQANAMIAQGVNPQAVLENELVPAMAKVGTLFEEGEYFVPELLISARAMQKVMEILNPLLKAEGVSKIGKVVIGTVKGDMHDIGKNLVASMLEGGGFEVVDLGVNVAPEKFVEAVGSDGKVILALSALLTTTMPEMAEVIEMLNKAGSRGNVRIMVGGAPVTNDYAKSIGADGYSENANGAVQLARRFLQG